MCIYSCLRWLGLTLYIVLLLCFLSGCFGDKDSFYNLSETSKRLYFRIDPVHPDRCIADYPGNAVSDVPKTYAMEEQVRKNSLDSSKTLAQAGLVYPFVNQSLTNFTGQIHLRPAVAYGIPLGNT